MFMKILNIQVPFIFKHAVDTLNVPHDMLATSGGIMLTSAGTLLLGCECQRRVALIP